ncbi:MAG TPA: hypothetical protein VM492_13500 [Sumerlaeia bacterium]|nr:hypothetical protein [Sumerlaeia bacterium]
MKYSDMTLEQLEQELQRQQMILVVVNRQIGYDKRLKSTVEHFVATHQFPEGKLGDLQKQFFADEVKSLEEDAKSMSAQAKAIKAEIYLIKAEIARKQPAAPTASAAA